MAKITPPVAPPTGTSVAASDLGVWLVESYSGTDDQKFAAALADWAASTNGGTIDFGRKTYSLGDHYNLANLGGVGRPKQKYLRLRGQGAMFNGAWGAPDQSATVIDWTYEGTGLAKLETFGLGTLEITGICFKNTSGAVAPLPWGYTTNTTVVAHDNALWGNTADQSAVQDFWIFGGTTTNLDGTETAAFQGYGSRISNNYCYQIRQLAVGQTYSNSVRVVGNTAAYHCGSNDATKGFITVIGTAANNVNGWYIVDNLIETTNYPYAIVVDYGQGHIIGPNEYWDPSALGAPSLANVYLGGHATNNLVIVGYYGGSVPAVVEASPGNNTIIDANSASPASVGSVMNTLLSIVGQKLNVVSGVLYGAPDPSVLGPVAVTSSGITTATFADGATISGSKAFTSIAASLATTDAGKSIKGTNIPAHTTVATVPTTTVAAGSNGAALPQATINVASTTGMQSSGTVLITSDAGVQRITYTGITGTSFTGCTGGTGNLATGNAVLQAVLSAAATATGTGLSFSIYARTGSPGISVGGIVNATGATSNFGAATNKVAVGTLGTSDVWIDAEGSNANISLNLRAQGSGTIQTRSTITMSDATNLAVGTTTGTKIGTTGGAAGQKIGFFGATPVVQQLMATGAAHTVDDVITALQTLGLFRQT